ncbi:hypothetical protein [Terribacillus sp. FSL K6-0262]|uniref:hypothetical protein n=1 Tax=Terribacillus sp. FSL K6-0262 TaxID=2921447 RepID=UPI0030EC6AD2
MTIKKDRTLISEASDSIKRSSRFDIVHHRSLAEIQKRSSGIWQPELRFLFYY